MNTQHFTIRPMGKLIEWTHTVPTEAGLYWVRTGWNKQMYRESCPEVMVVQLVIANEQTKDEQNIWENCVYILGSEIEMFEPEYAKWLWFPVPLVAPSVEVLS